MNTYKELLGNPSFFQENRKSAHSDHIVYSSREELEQTGTSQFRESLNGVWKFHYAKNFDQVIPGFEKTEYNAKVWDDIYVPAHIQMEGYGVPQYCNTQYPWDGLEDIMPGECPKDFNPIANYVKYFYLPDRMKGHKVFLSFQGVESCFALYLNGQYVGFSGDSFTPSEFEITDFLKDGENKIAVQVMKWYSGSWLEDQDFFRFSGIFRDVYLFYTADEHVWDIKVDAHINDDFSEAVVKYRLKTAGGTGKIEVELLDPSKQVLEISTAALEDTVTGEFKIDNPLLWSAEKSYLYRLSVSVFDKNDNQVEWFEQKVGIRSFMMDGNIMKLNGKRIVFKGVNRHEFSSISGRVVTEEELIHDLLIMKRNNINAIRTCHYPNSSKIYELADEMGFYLIDECNMETHGTWDAYLRTARNLDYIVPRDHDEYKNMLLDRVTSMYERDKNHPSILIWSCGNESYGGSVIASMTEALKKADPSRLVHYEGVFRDRSYPATSDMESQMYTTVEDIKKFLAVNRDKPMICCEYMHAMGNSCGAMHKYTDLTDEDVLYQGGFIWDFIDQSIRKKDRYGKEYLAYGGDHHERPTDYSFSGNGLLDGYRNEYAKVQEVKYNYQNISIRFAEDSFTVNNKNLFTSTAEYDCFVVMEKEGRVIREVKLETDVKPLFVKSFKLPFDTPKCAGEYVITVSFRLKNNTFWAQQGYEVAFEQKVVKVEGQIIKPVDNGLTVIDGVYNIGVKGDSFQVLFSRLNGGLVSYKFAGREMLEDIPKPNFWRAPTDNDLGNRMPFRYAQWKAASMYADFLDPAKGEENFKMPNPIIENLENAVKVAYTYYHPTVPMTASQLTYIVYGDGTVETELEYEPVNQLSKMPEFSVMFKLNADYNNLKWYGYGPAECYCDRMRGAKLGVFSKTVAENSSSYLVPQENGNHTGVRWIKITDVKERGLLFNCNNLDVSVSPYTPHELENAKHVYELPDIHYTVIRVGNQMGVGGDDSWGALVHDEYLLDDSKKMKISFSFKGI